MQHVDLETGKSARGVRIVSSAIVPSPWSEAAKALFTIAKVPFVVVRAVPRDPAIAGWTGAHTCPLSFTTTSRCDRVVADPALAARLGDVLPRDLHDRVTTTGLIHEIAGEDGLGWNARLMMIHAGLTTNGARGLRHRRRSTSPRSTATRPSGSPRRARVRSRSSPRSASVSAVRRIFGGDRPNALDAYVATFLTPLREISEADCPSLQPPMRAGLAAAADELGAHVPPSLFALRARMFERHLEWPIMI